MAEQIKAGDTVQLKSGGPVMTVNLVEDWNGIMRARCDWFVGGKNSQDYFPLASLKIVKE